MGWTFERRPASVKQHFIDMVNYETDYYTQRVLEVKIVKLRTLYAAVERVNKATGEREVFAAVHLLAFTRSQDGYDFGWKDQDEFMGPYASECPASILDKLTPTDHEFAVSWRERCRANLNKPKPIDITVNGVVRKTYEKLRLAQRQATKLARAEQDAEVIVHYKPTNQAWRIHGWGGFTEVTTG